MTDNNKVSIKEQTERLLCLVGIHNFQVIEVSFTFGDSGHIEKLQCKRCKMVICRRAN